MRVPTPDVSIVDLTAGSGEAVTVDEVNDAFRSGGGRLKDCGVGGAVVSVITGHPASAIVDLLSTFVIEERMVKVWPGTTTSGVGLDRGVDLAKYVADRL